MNKRALSIFTLLLAGLTCARLATGSAAAAEDFGQWLDGVKRDATAAGVPAEAVESALRGLEPIPHVIELDQRQPENTISLDTYLGRVLKADRIKEGRAELAQNAPLLRAVATDYGVPAKVIVALWAIESSFGHVTGDYRTVDALATLAFDGRRPEFFRAELINALKILGRGPLESADLKGSWAGAMGQTQFMPSTYLHYAVEYRHGGQPDIWHNKGDVFASAANYLSKLGWTASESWGREVRLPARFDAGLIGLPVQKSVADWAKLGVRRADRGALPKSAVRGSIVAPDGAEGRAFLVYDNFRTVMKWNRSTYFALAVGMLGDAIGGR